LFEKVLTIGLRLVILYTCNQSQPAFLSVTRRNIRRHRSTERPAVTSRGRLFFCAVGGFCANNSAGWRIYTNVDNRARAKVPSLNQPRFSSRPSQIPNIANMVSQQINIRPWHKPLPDSELQRSTALQLDSKKDDWLTNHDRSLPHFECHRATTRPPNPTSARNATEGAPYSRTLNPEC